MVQTCFKTGRLNNYLYCHTSKWGVFGVKYRGTQWGMRVVIETGVSVLNCTKPDIFVFKNSPSRTLQWKEVFILPERNSFCLFFVVVLFFGLCVYIYKGLWLKALLTGCIIILDLNTLELCGVVQTEQRTYQSKSITGREGAAETSWQCDQCTWHPLNCTEILQFPVILEQSFVHLVRLSVVSLYTKPVYFKIDGLCLCIIMYTLLLLLSLLILV